MILAERAARVEAEAAAARERATNSSTDALIGRLKLEIEKLRRELYGTRSERKARLLDQMEMQLEDLEADATEDELAAEIAARATSVVAFQRKRPARRPFPDHLPRERIVVAAPESCARSGTGRTGTPTKHAGRWQSSRRPARPPPLNSTRCAPSWRPSRPRPRPPTRRTKSSARLPPRKLTAWLSG